MAVTMNRIDILCLCYRYPQQNLIILLESLGIVVISFLAVLLVCSYQ